MASVCPKTWHPTIVLVRNEEGRCVGLLYAKERKLFGVRTGLFFADATLGALIASEYEDDREVFEVAINELLASGRVRGFRLLVDPNGYEMAVARNLKIPANLKLRTAATQCHLVLPLAADYEHFLSRLSYKTRRNFRYFRNRSEKAGHVYVEDISMDEFVPAAWKLEAENTVGGHREPLQRAIEILQTARRPLLVALKSSDGEMLSFVGGWYEGDRVVIFMQLNSDKRHAKYSLSLVTRAYLIESLIRQRCTEVVWWAGVSEPISHYCAPVPTVAACLDDQGLPWRIGRGLIERNRSRVPKRLRELAEMLISPAPPEARFGEPDIFPEPTR